jgi:hypothetical protein
VFAFLLIVALIASSGAAPRGALAEEITFPTSELWIETENGRHHFAVEVATTRAQMARGLMFREDLAADAGMLFDYETPRELAMWMKNTLVALDMLFVDQMGVVRRVVAWTVPLSLEPIPSHGPVRAVIELRGGTTERLGIMRGSTVGHEIFGTAGGPAE